MSVLATPTLAPVAGRIFVNPHSGPDDTPLDDLRTRFAGHSVEECQPDELVDRINRAVGEPVDFIGVAGGDGTIRSAVQILHGTSTPLLVIPAGTRNHFARDLGIADLDAAEDAVRTNRTRVVDLGRVNDRYFVNNSSVGSYPQLVRRRERHERRMPKAIANVIAAYQQLRRGRRLRCEIDGSDYVVWLVFVGNGRYGDTIFDVLDRDALDANTLDVRIVRAEPRFARFRLLLAVLFGRLAHSKCVEQHSAASMRLSAGSTVDVALDGEVERLTSPLEYASVSQALVVLVCD